jgi:hypothetical protein
MEDRVYHLKTNMKVLCWVVGVICIPLIVTIPAAVLMIMLAVRARLELRQDRLLAVWVRTREIPYSEIGGLSWGAQNAGGLMGMLMGRPIHYHDLQGNRKFWGIMVEAYENRDEALGELEARTGHKIA